MILSVSLYKAQTMFLCLRQYCFWSYTAMEIMWTKINQKICSWNHKPIHRNILKISSLLPCYQGTRLPFFGLPRDKTYFFRQMKIDETNQILKAEWKNTIRITTLIRFTFIITVIISSSTTNTLVCCLIVLLLLKQSIPENEIN